MSTTFVPLHDLHSASWHQQRALGIGGSDAASMFNEGYGCHRRLVMEKRGIEPDYRHTAATEKLFKRGHIGEQIVADLFCEETGLKVRKQPAKVSKTHPHARVNMDRQIVAVDPVHLLKITTDEHGFSPLANLGFDPGPGALECKTMNSFDFKRIQKEGLTKHNHYILQLQHSMAVPGYKWGMFAIADLTTLDLIWFPMLRNDALCAELLDRSENTWDWVMDSTRPLPAALPDGDKRCGKCLHRRTCRGDAYLVEHAGADFSTDYIETADPEIVELATDLVDAEEAEDRAATVTKAIKDRIKARMLADKTAKLKVPDVIRFCLSTTAGRKTLDAKAVDGEINAMRKGETFIDPSQFQPDQLEAASPVVSALLSVLADRIDNCRKVGAPSTTFRTYSV